jgi:polyhydroxybutyrate depolymerase
MCFSLRIKCLLASMLGLLAVGLTSLSPLRAAPVPDAATVPCPQDGACLVATGEYRVHAPQGWDGHTPLPMVLYFHGYRESAGEIVAREDLRAVADRRRVLLVVPNGQGGTWSHPGSPAQYRDEFKFVDLVMADLVRRYPVDRSHVLVAGFSQGAAMVWNLMCYQGDRFAAFLPISGTFWTPQPETCPTVPRKLIHIHGVSDRTVPLDGRPIRNGAFRQGDVFKALGMVRQANHCPASGARAQRHEALICEIATGCDVGSEIAFCLHPGGHDFDPDWIELGLDQMKVPAVRLNARGCPLSGTANSC